MFKNLKNHLRFEFLVLHKLLPSAPVDIYAERLASPLPPRPGCSPQPQAMHWPGFNHWPGLPLCNAGFLHSQCLQPLQPRCNKTIHIECWTCILSSNCFKPVVRPPSAIFTFGTQRAFLLQLKEQPST